MQLIQLLFSIILASSEMTSLQLVNHIFHSALSISFLQPTPVVYLCSIHLCNWPTQQKCAYAPWSASYRNIPFKLNLEPR